MSSAVIVSASWCARYVRTQPPSRRAVTVASSPEAGDVCSNERLTSTWQHPRLRRLIHFSWIRVSSETSGNSPSTFDR